MSRITAFIRMLVHSERVIDEPCDPRSIKKFSTRGRTLMRAHSQRRRRGGSDVMAAWHVTCARPDVMLISAIISRVQSVTRSKVVARWTLMATAALFVFREEPPSWSSKHCRPYVLLALWNYSSSKHVTYCITNNDIVTPRHMQYVQKEKTKNIFL